MSKIPFFDYPRLFTDDRKELLEIFEEVGSRGAFILQKDLEDFERTFSSYTQSKHSVGVANGTDGMELALLAIGLEPGDEVICSSHTMIATASAIKVAGGVPIPVEIGEDNLIDPGAVEAAITARTVGIMPTQLNGRICNMDRLCEIAHKHGLFLVEDAAQALGSRFKGQHAGTFGEAGSFSLFPAKVLGCLGDGGAVITNSDELYSKIYQLHDHGRDVTGEVKSWGRNSRLDNLQAAILNYRFASYGDVIARRRQIASMYQEQLGFLQELQLPPAPTDDGDNFDVYQNYELQADSRDELKDHLAQQGVGTLIQWGGKGLHQWEHLDFDLHLPKVELFFERCLMLPMNMFINDSDVSYICEKIVNFYRS